jgi:hypothetical protein
MADDVDADGRRICPSCGAIFGPPRDLASALAITYLAIVREHGRFEVTEDDERFAAGLARGGEIDTL